MALQTTLQEVLGVKVKDPAVRKAVAEARKEKDDRDASFDKLPGLSQQLKEQNPGTSPRSRWKRGGLRWHSCAPARVLVP